MLIRHETLTLFFLLQLLQCGFSLVNLSINKTTDMSSSQYSDKWLADEAVDGDVTQKLALGSCAVTSDNFHKQAWWRVDLGDVYVLNSVKIYYRKESEDQSFTFRLSGFSVYVADTLNWWIGTRCYLHNNGVQVEPYPSDILTVLCNATGRYVTVYKDRNLTCDSDEYKNPNFCTKLELCEVNVLSCEDGTYGKSCSNNCSGNCLYGVHCNKAHGGCDDRCAPGFRGFYCRDVCKDGTYGLGCLNICGHCSSFPCNHINGTCLHGCAPGWKSLYCNQSCSYGTFGQNCKETCSKHCNTTRICNHVNGTCDGGCQAGWMNHNCNESCPFGKYGVNCEYKCSENCIKSLTCKRDNGYCEGGCSDGWKGNHCNQKCNHGFYGNQCLYRCKSCTETCHHLTGRCLVYDKQTMGEETIAIIVTCGVVITGLTVALLITCLRLRRHYTPNVTVVTSSNTVNQEERRVQLSNSNINPNDTVNEMSPESVSQASREAYEDLNLSTSADSNTYQSLQPGRQVTYTNTEFF